MMMVVVVVVVVVVATIVVKVVATKAHMKIHRAQSFDALYYTIVVSRIKLEKMSPY